MNTSPVIHARNLRRVFRHADHKFNLHVPEIELYAGQAAVFQGASGCGKSTLFDMLGLIARADACGDFIIHGTARNESMNVLTASESVLTQMRSEMIGYVLQHGGLIPSLTVKENILIPSKLTGRRTDKSRFSGLVEQLGIADQIMKKPSRLSGGQQQRVAIARALINRPSIVLADEPTGQLDVFTAADVRDLLINYVREDNMLLLVVTHDPELFRSHADREFGFDIKGNICDIHSTLVEKSLDAKRS